MEKTSYLVSGAHTPSTSLIQLKEACLSEPSRAKSLAAIIDEAEQAVIKVFGTKFLDMLYSKSPDVFKLTENEQPRTVFEGFLLYQLFCESLKRQGDITVSELAGHSIGYIGALVNANALTIKEGLKFSALTASSMIDTHKTGKLVIVLGMEEGKVQDLIGKINDSDVSSCPFLQIANYNSPTVLGVSGPQTLIDDLQSRLSGAVEVITIADYPYHNTELMLPAAKTVAKGIVNISFQNPSVPVRSYVSGKLLYSASEIAEEFLDTMTSPVNGHVNWARQYNRSVVSCAIEEGVTSFLVTNRHHYRWIKNYDPAIPITMVNLPINNG